MKKNNKCIKYQAVLYHMTHLLNAYLFVCKNSVSQVTNMIFNSFQFDLKNNSGYDETIMLFFVRITRDLNIPAVLPY